MVDLRLGYQSSETIILISHRKNIRKHKIKKKIFFVIFVTTIYTCIWVVQYRLQLQWDT